MDYHILLRLPVFTIISDKTRDSMDPVKEVSQPMVLTNSIPLGSIWASIASRIKLVVDSYRDDNGEDSIVAIASLTYALTKPGSTNIMYNAENKEQISVPNMTA